MKRRNLMFRRFFYLTGLSCGYVDKTFVYLQEQGGISMLQKKQVTPTLPDYQSVVIMYHEAFPANEKLPLWYLQFLTLRKGISFRVYYDDDQLVGMSYTTKTQNIIFVLTLQLTRGLDREAMGRKFFSSSLEKIQIKKLS